MRSDNYDELQDLWKTSYPIVKFDIPAPAPQPVRARRPRPIPLLYLTADNINSSSIPLYPTSPFPSSPHSSYHIPARPHTAKSHQFKQNTKAKFQHIASSFQTQINSKLVRKIMNIQSQRAEKKERAKRVLVKEEFHRNWDSMTEDEQAAVLKAREETRVRERRRLEDIKNGSNESRKSDAKSASFAGAVVVCM